MADDLNRVELHNPGSDSGVIAVAEEQVDRFLNAGWERVGRGRRRAADTGATPVQGRSSSPTGN